MRRLLLITLVVQFCCLSGALAAAPQSAEPTKASVLALADKYTGWCEPKLTDQDRAAVRQIKEALAQSKRAGDVFYQRTFHDIVNNLTMKLAGAKSLNGLTVASAFLVKEAPQDRRALNLLGSVLHTYDKDKDAIAVFQYALSLDPGNLVISLNLANAYLDEDQDDRAKVLLDKLEFDDPDNKGVYRALATYWYRKNNAAKFREYLFKAAQFKGYKRKKADKQKQAVEADDVKANESTAVMEAKLKRLETIIPLTTADIIEVDFPAAAGQIRDKYGKLGVNEKWILPKLPVVNLNGPYDFERNAPIVGEWAGTAVDKLKKFPLDQAKRAGVDPNASDAVKEAQGRAAARKQMEEALQQAQQTIKLMENMPGVSKADIEKARRELDKVMKEHGIEATGKPADLAGPPPGVDSGSLFAEENYYNFILISTSYEKYFVKYFQEYNARIADIYKRGQQEVLMENARFEPEWSKLQEEHDIANEGKYKDHGEHDEVCRKAMIQHKRRLNAISDKYYRQWSGLYFPEYAQKMKPTLDAYWNVCMLHIRNMNDPKVMEREYDRVTMAYFTYATQAISGIGGGGFGYHPEVEEKEFQLEQEIARAREEAEARKDEFKQGFPAPEFSWSDWITDNFSLEISGQFLGLKVTARSIEFQSNLPGVTAGVKYDFQDEKFESYTAAGGKLNVGVNICGVGVKAEAGGEAWRRTATWDLKNGTYYESNTAKAEAKGSLGPLSVGTDFQLDAHLNAKVSTTASIMGATIQYEQQLQ